MRRCPTLLLAVVSSLLCTVPAVEAKIFCVSTPAALTTALAKASKNGANDEIRIVRGTYAGTFTYSATEAFSLTLTGGYGTGCGKDQVIDPEATILDGGGAGTVLSLSGGATAGLTVRYLTLANGDAKPTGPTAGRGGGLYLNKGNLTLKRVVVRDNLAAVGGAGISVWESPASSSSVTVLDSLVEGNLGGAGIDVQGRGAVTLTGNTIRGNGNETGAGQKVDGGGVSGVFCDSLTMTGNTVSGNGAYYGNGGGVMAYCRNVTLAGNRVTGNVALTGGGMYVEAGERVVLTNNTITGNATPDIDSYLGAYGGARVNLGPLGFSATINNNIIWDNTGGTGAGSVDDLYIKNGPHGGSYIPVVMTHNDFDRSAAGFGISQPFYSIDASNRDDQDPLFADPAGEDFRLGLLSPCRDQGDNAAPAIPAADLDGNPRIVGGIIDQGAYEAGSNLLFSDDFSDRSYADAWNVLGGTWSITKGEPSLQSGYFSPAIATARNIAPAAGRIEADLKMTAVSLAGPNAGVIFDAPGKKGFRYVRILPGKIVIGLKLAGAPKKTVPLPALAVGKGYRLRVDFYPDGFTRATVFEEGTTIGAADSTFPTPAIPGQVGLWTATARSVFDNVRIWDETALPPR
jgi:hypothetical protein